MDITNILAYNKYYFTSKTYPDKVIAGRTIRREINFYNMHEDANGYLVFFTDNTVSYNVKKGRKKAKDFFSDNREARMNRISKLLFKCKYNEHRKPISIKKQRISSFR